MTALAWLIPCALFLGLVGLAAFLWSLNSGQFEDLEGAGWRALAGRRTWARQRPASAERRQPAVHRAACARQSACSQASGMSW